MIIDRWFENRTAAGFCLGLSAVLCAVMAMDPTSTEWLRYDRQAIESGEIWRLFSGHLTHASWAHTGLNVAGLVLVALLFPEPLGYRHWLLRLLFMALLTSALMYLFSPTLGWYVGLSGVLHGLFVLGFWWAFRNGDRFSLLLLGVLVAKLVVEHFHGPITSNDELVGVPVFTRAHSYGAIASVIYLLISAGFYKFRKFKDLEN